MGLAELSSSGEIEIYSDEGTFIERLSKESVITGDGASVTPSFEISKDQKQIFVTFDEEIVPEVSSENTITPFVDQGCAFNNVLSGLGIGAGNGLMGGLPGVVAGGMAGLLGAGIQSATGC